MTDPERSTWWWWGPAIVLMAGIFAMSSTAQLPALPSGSDKQVHGAVYGVLALLVVRARTRGHIPAITVWDAAFAWILATVYGASDEFHQWFVPGRSADWLDLAADAAGAFAAVSALWACGIIARSMQARSRHVR